jgi:predicted helicase
MNEKLTPSYSEYINDVAKEYASGIVTEHSFRPALKNLIERLESGILAVNEPKRIDCGAPDYVIKRGEITVGYIEAKDIGVNLNEIEKSEQLQRYFKSLSNLVLTDYLEFRWYVNGIMHLSARLGTTINDGKIKRVKEGITEVASLLDNFLSHTAEKVGTPKELAGKMARMAHMVRDLIIKAFNQEEESGALHSQLAAFQENLIPDLSAEQFADMYAQTIAYGLFAARCTAPENKIFTRQNAAYMLPKTNPFLRKLFNNIAGPELDDRIAWLVDDLAQVLAQVDMEAVLKNFGKHSGKEDPVVHFYETFLIAYDDNIRKLRGVYYTPEPVVSYIVRSIDYLLKTRFNKPQGLADDNTLILDPATGTATFLYNVINEIHQSFAGQEGMWNDYVAEKLLKRIFGFELLMAPYTVAHLKLGLLLKETGYKFHSDERLGIYLTNTLDEAFKKSEQLVGFNQYIVEETNAAAEIKKEKPIMVVLGNPPYSGVSANKSEIEVELLPGQTYIDHLRFQVSEKESGEKVAYWSPIQQKASSRIRKRIKTFIGRLIEDYKIVDGNVLSEKNPKMLQDDYVKFIRFGQWRIEKTGQGILGFITNHGYIDNITFRGMRQSLMDTFTDIYILNLHGNSKKKEVAPDGGKDENVFDIQQGVSISIFVKEEGKTSPAKVRYADLWGLREGKYKTLFESDVQNTEWVEVKPNSPDYFFLPREENLRTEYEKGWKVNDIFNTKSVGIITSRDDFVLDFNKMALIQRITNFINDNRTIDEIRIRFLKPTDKLDIIKSRQVLSGTSWVNCITNCYYRPFDIRHILYNKQFIDRSREDVMSHLINKDNIAMMFRRQYKNGPFSYVLVGKNTIEARYMENAYSHVYTNPLYLYPTEEKKQVDKSGGKEGGIQPIMALQTKREPNLNNAFIKEVEGKLGLKFINDGKGNIIDNFGPEDIFNYAYAIFHSPTYRTRYAELLKIDFPRLPLTSDKELFKALVEKGAELVSLHLMESPMLNTLITKYPIDDSHKVEKVDYNENNQRVYINKTQYFEGVPPEVWNFHIGGYQVCHKWLKDRKDRTLSYDERIHYQKIVVVLKETIRLMEEIDGIIPSWPIE